MARVLAISSQVARGHVGLSATALALERLGHEVWRLPTILLSNHPGHPRMAAVATPPDKLAAMIDALGANGWLEEVDAVLTGYLPSAAHVAVAAEAVTRVRARAARAVAYVCDPVLGDDPKGLYIAIEAAAAIRDRLVPLADVLTPNRFEIGWLTARPVGSLAQVRAAASVLGRPQVVVTSAEIADGAIATLSSSGDTAVVCRAAHVARAPHGTGDLMAGLLLGHALNGAGSVEALGRAVAGVAAAIAASAGADELRLAIDPAGWSQVPPLPVEGLA